jgi:hypothetical protein
MSKNEGAGRKSRRRAIAALRRLIAAHERKVAADPDAPEAAHWRVEITAFEREIRRHERRLGHA